MNKQLRVLTGTHAGTQITLQSLDILISADEQADIQITDWRHEPLKLVLNEEDNVVTVAIASVADSRPHSGELRAFEDFVPRRFGDIVLCIGSALMPWPSDIDLMSRLMNPPAAAKVPGSRRRNTFILCGAGAALSLAVAFSLLVARTTSAGQGSKPNETLLTQVHRAVSSLGLPGVAASAFGERVVVRGLVESVHEVGALRRQLESFPAGRIDHEYAAAADIVQSIADALGQPTLTVSHQGQGVFLVTGQSMDVPKVQQAAARIARDLGPSVQRIGVSVTAVPLPDRMPVGAAMAVGRLQYVQTRDGAKHLTMLPEPIEELVDQRPEQ